MTEREILAWIEATLGAALEVRPSPGFEAGVRRRIDVARKASRVRVSRWLWPAAAAVLVALGSRLLDRAPSPRLPSVADPRPLAGVDARPLGPPVFPPGPPPRARALSASARPGPGAGAEKAMVLVPPDQQVLLRRLVRALDRMPVAQAAAGPDASGLAGIEVPPLRVRPVAIEPVGVLELYLEPTRLRPLALEPNEVEPLRVEP